MVYFFAYHTFSKTFTFSKVKVFKKFKSVSLNSIPVATAVKVACKAQNPFGHNISDGYSSLFKIPYRSMCLIHSGVGL